MKKTLALIFTLSTTTLIAGCNKENIAANLNQDGIKVHNLSFNISRLPECMAQGSAPIPFKYQDGSGKAYEICTDSSGGVLRLPDAGKPIVLRTLPR